MWVVTYSDGTTDTFEDMSLELICEYLDASKSVISIVKL